MAAEVKNPMNKSDEKTGNWFYLCQGCHQPALIFKGEPLPALGLSIDELEYIALGTHRSRQIGIIICGWCKRPVDFDPEGRINQKCVIQVDSWCKAKGKKISEFGVTGRTKQDGEKFFDRDEEGNIIPSKSETRCILRATAPDRPKVFSTLEAP